MYIYMCVNICVYVNVYNIYIYTCICICIYIYIHNIYIMYICIHIYGTKKFVYDFQTLRCLI
jgi:hypothetical protein